MLRVLQKQVARLLIKFQSYKSNETCRGEKKIDKQQKKTAAKPGNLQTQQSSSRFEAYHHFQQPEKG